jgi:GT2 family glycosyltransferase
MPINPVSAADDIAWDGHTLSLPASWGSRIALDLDGEYFSDVQADAEGRLRVAFPFSPSGHAQLALTPRVARNGSALSETPLGIEIGNPGLRHGCEPIALAAPIDTESLCNIDNAALPGEIAIIVPVYNAPAAVARCLASVLKHTTGNARLIVIDDASTDPAITPLLARHAGLRGIDVLANDRNLGFTATVNRGMEMAGRADVVLLNADTEVGPNWLTGLRRAAHSRDDIATATAVSDNAGAFSVPELEHENAWPPIWSLDQTARALWQNAGHAYPALPTGNGFCMYIRRDVLDAVGVFDAEAFPQGYGEENDFCQRAAAAGYRHVIAGNVFVHHERSLSFGIERREALGRSGMQVLRERWPHYETEVGATLFSYERRVLDWRVRRIHASAETTNLPVPRVFRLAEATDHHTIAGYELWTCIRHGDELVLMRDTQAGAVIVEHASIGTFPTRIFADWLQRHAFELSESAIDGENICAQALTQAANRLGIAHMTRIGSTQSTESRYAAALATIHSFVEAPA